MRGRLRFALVSWALLAGLVAGSGLHVASAGTDPKAQPGATDDPVAAARAEAAESYDKLVGHYMHGRWEQFVPALRGATRRQRHMTRRQRLDLLYMRKTAGEFRPSWWGKCTSAEAVSFPARIWGRRFTANYMPTSATGFSAPVDIVNGRIRVLVSWRPNMVNNAAPAGGRLARAHKIRKGDIGEVIVWHELGHNYITEFLPLRSTLTLYREHFLLFQHLQEFYADMTALHHAAPPARRAMLFLRLDALDDYRESSAHTRAAHAIAALLLAEILADPESWPSVHLPGEAPDRDLERKTIIYVYEHLDPSWTLAEDRALRELAGEFIRRKGEDVLRHRGRIDLTSDLPFMLMAGADREAQAQRNAWVAEKLQAAIDADLADDPEKAGKNRRGRRIIIPW